jgi:tRNA splicing endonuclease
MGIMVKIKFLIFFLLLTAGSVLGKEGMWIPLYLQQFNISEMEDMGLQLTAGDIYDTNNSSLKDAVVIFGGGCTGAVISGDGLLITNHHCGYRNIQYHSSLENDYLTDGFWAVNKDEELPNPGLSVKFLEYMEDVTGRVLNIPATTLTGEYETNKRENIDKIIKEASEDGKFSAEVKPLFYGNQYFLYVYKIYRDVRLVGAPPSSIGKFGGDTDNWMWPRHTGDFSLFRIYAGKDNEPAGYSPDNIPLKPKKYFPVSLKGIEHGDFTMVYGNPGTTSNYIPSKEVEIIVNQRNPDRIEIRDKILDVLKSAMESDAAKRIQYASKYASISNAWKKWQGEIAGLERMEAVSRKLQFEDDFKKWAIQNGTWDDKYREVFHSFDSLYFIYENYIKAGDYYTEVFFRGINIFQPALLLNSLIKNIKNGQHQIAEHQLQSLAGYFTGFYKDHDLKTEGQLFKALLPVPGNSLNELFLPDHYRGIMKRYGEDKLISGVFRKSVLNDSLKIIDYLREGDKKKLLKLANDPVIKLANQLYFHRDAYITPVLDSLSIKILANMKIYMQGIMEMHSDKKLYPDANGTLRIAYGKVEGYKPSDGIEYKHYTTLKGVIDKDNPGIYDYSVPDRLKELYELREYGIYSQDSIMPVCFTASNHTTGGNSGSPVLNSRGELIGVNFDRCWEGTMSDIMYDPEMCRNIAIDIRYALFLIDYYAGAGYLLDEMDIRR